MVILPSQLLKDLSLMILTNFLPLWNETALRQTGGESKVTPEHVVGDRILDHS
jgi:hypothetical protein